MSASVIRSPSSVNRIRNTPCVLGCCGPMLTTNGSVFIDMDGVSLSLVMPQLSSWGARTRAASSSPPLPPPLQRTAWLPREPLQPRHLAAREVQPVLAQRMPREAVPEEDATQVRVALEADAHQVVSLALLEVRPAPDQRHRRHLRVLAVVRTHLERRREVVAYREQVVDDLEVVQPVDSAQRAEEAEAQLRVVAQERAGLDQVIGLHLRPLRRGFGDGVRELLLDAVSDVEAREDRRNSPYLPQPEGWGARQRIIIPHPLRRC